MRNIPIVTKNLLIINILAFIAGWVLELRGINLDSVGGLHFFLASDFHLYQFVTYMFLHANLMHIFFNMFALWMFGRIIENVWGSKKFLFYYITCGIGAGLIQEIAQFVSLYFTINGQDPTVGFMDMFQVAGALSHQLNAWTTIGASGAIYAILLAFGMTFPNERIFIFPLPVPIKAKWFVMFYVAIELFSAFNAPGDGVAHMAHLGGMLFGFFMIRYWNSHPGIGYSKSSGTQFFTNLKRSYDKYKENSGNKRDTDKRNGDSSANNSNPKASDWEYNAKKKASQDEVDRILDKIRKSGYDSLTKEEKQKLFDSSNDD